MNKYNFKGFTLLEMSMVLMILGLVAAGSFSLFARKADADKRNETRDRLKYIKEVMAVYARTHGYLPCPAENTTFDNSSYGTVISPYDECFYSSTVKVGSEVITGNLPVYNLGLPDKYMFDGWGNRILYAVSMFFTDNNLVMPTYKIPSTLYGKIIIRDGTQPTPNELLDADGNGTTDNSEKAFALVLSFGENGHGAYQFKGGGSVISKYGALSGHEMEEDNAHTALNPTTDNVFRILPERKNAGASPTTVYNDQIFDDMVEYIVRPNICIDKDGQTGFSLDAVTTAYCQ